MSSVVDFLCVLVSLLCAVMLFRGFFRGGHRMLLWSGLCFAGLTVNNILGFLDLILPPRIDLFPQRLIVSSVSVLVLLLGLLWEGE